MHLDIYEPIWFKFGIMIDSSELYFLILVYMTMTLISPTLTVADGIREMISKETCKYGEYGPFEHFLFF